MMEVASRREQDTKLRYMAVHPLQMAGCVAEVRHVVVLNTADDCAGLQLSSHVCMADLIRKTVLLAFVLLALLIVILLQLWQLLRHSRAPPRKKATKKEGRGARARKVMGDDRLPEGQMYGIGPGVHTGLPRATRHRIDPALYVHLPSYMQPLSDDDGWVPPPSALPLAWGSTQTSYESAPRSDDRGAGMGPMSSLMADPTGGRPDPLQLHLSPTCTMDASTTVLVEHSTRSQGGVSVTMHDEREVGQAAERPPMSSYGCGGNCGVLPSSSAAVRSPLPRTRPVGRVTTATAAESPQVIERIIPRCTTLFTRRRYSRDDAIHATTPNNQAIHPPNLHDTGGLHPQQSNDGEESQARGPTTAGETSANDNMERETGDGYGSRSSGGMPSGKRKNARQLAFDVVTDVMNTHSTVMADSVDHASKCQCEVLQRQCDIMEREAATQEKQCEVLDVGQRMLCDALLKIASALRGNFYGRDFGFENGVTKHGVHHNEVDADRDTCLHLTIGYGFGKRLLRQVVIFTRKVGTTILDCWVGGSNVLTDIIDLLVSNVAMGFEGRLHEPAMYVVHAEPPFVDLSYLHGEVRIIVDEFH
ncbi:hypothetical protein CBR_g819 [Chara braunii]|uniref:Uncharacterized protein n=1 Tax=Chara braunii TaxID=69332 RepID=A0A388KCD2_CHABU|nr:hypothetical protein CBR_g819 [Chara braunii]|eukprot:GBG67691.1 hypothetical protein CBR_g819 [Chara braunii]